MENPHQYRPTYGDILPDLYLIRGKITAVAKKVERLGLELSEDDLMYLRNADDALANFESALLWM